MPKNPKSNQTKKIDTWYYSKMISSIDSMYKIIQKQKDYLLVGASPLFSDQIVINFVIAASAVIVTYLSGPSLAHILQMSPPEAWSIPQFLQSSKPQPHLQQLSSELDLSFMRWLELELME